MRSSKNKNYKVYVFFILFLIGVVFLFFNESGIFKYLKLNSEVKSLKEQIKDLESDNKNLESEIDSLRNKVPAKIEKIAREKYNMKRPNEKSIEIIEK